MLLASLRCYSLHLWWFYLLLNHMSSVQVQEVTLEGRPSVREVHLQDGGFGPAEEAGVQVIMMGHTTLNVFTTSQIYKYTNNTHKYRNTQRKEMSNYSQCNVSQLSLHPTLQCEHCILLGAKSNCWWLYSPGDVWGKSPRLNAVSRCYVLPSSRRCIAYLLVLVRGTARALHIKYGVNWRFEQLYGVYGGVTWSGVSCRGPRLTVSSLLARNVCAPFCIFVFQVLYFLVFYIFSYFRCAKGLLLGL